MTEQVYIGNFSQGLTLNRTAFNIDNSAFPFLWNFYVWRGRVKRKRGTELLGQLQFQVKSVAVTTLPWQFGPIPIFSGAGNLLTFAGTSMANGATIVPSTISLTYNGQVYIEPSPPSGTLTGSGGGTGVIDYATGNIYLTPVIPGPSTATGTYSVYPGNPVMGLEDFDSTITTELYPILVAFDTTTAYQFNDGTQAFYNVSFYKNSNIDVVWSGANYQQFWSTNYSGAMWVTNNKLGFNFTNAKVISASGSGTSFTIELKTNGLFFTNGVVGDYVWFNEFPATTTINNLTATITNNGGKASGQYVITFDQSVSWTINDTGIGQLLTNTITGQDGIKWYDGDPTGGTGLPTNPVSSTGWVNFAPPLTATTVSINNSPPGLYYLVGALQIIPFKDRLLFFSPWIQTSTGIPINLIDTVIWSWNGTPYYTASTISLGPPVVYTPKVTPSLGSGNYAANPQAFYVDQAGFGGFLSAGINQPIITVAYNQDVLIVNFGGGAGRKTRFVFTGNELQPFLFFNINLELPSFATFSSITLDKGVIDIGTYGIALTDQQSSQRIDLVIPDEVFEIQGLNFGVQRVNSGRDFFNEWIYFTYTPNNSPWIFPTQTFFFNYREYTWAIHYENYTTHGLYRATSNFTWSNNPFPSWSVWTDPWNSGDDSALFPDVVAGNPQGYVLIKAQGTSEGISGTITALANSNGATQITSINHCVNNNTIGIGDYLSLQNAIFNNGDAITAISSLGAVTIIFFTVNHFYIDQRVVVRGTTGTIASALNGVTATVIGVGVASIVININTLGLIYGGGGTVTSVFDNQVTKVISIQNSGGSPDVNNFVVDMQYPFLDVVATITGASNANPCVLNAINSFVVGQEVIINGVVGMTQLNGNTYMIIAATPTTITINVDSTAFTPYISGGTATLIQYLGLGQFSRLSLPLLQTKQFPFFWEQGRQARLSVQKYLMDTTAMGQVTINIYLSQDPDDVWNDPTVNIPPGTLIYSQLMYTCPESTNIGLTPLNTNLQMPIGAAQQQIWHRINTSLIGDTFQIGLTLSDTQMRDIILATDEITLHGMVLTADKGPHLA